MVVIAVGEATYQESLLAEKPKGEGEEGGEGSVVNQIDELVC